MLHHYPNWQHENAWVGLKSRWQIEPVLLGGHQYSRTPEQSVDLSLGVMVVVLEHFKERGFKARTWGIGGVRRIARNTDLAQCGAKRLGIA